MNELRKQMKPEMPDFPRLFEGKKSMMDMQGEKQQKMPFMGQNPFLMPFWFPGMNCFTPSDETSSSGMPFPGMSKKLLQQLLQQFLDMIFDAYSKEK